MPMAVLSIMTDTVTIKTAYNMDLIVIYAPCLMQVDEANC